MRRTIGMAVATVCLSSSLAYAVPTTIWAVEASATGSGTASNVYAEQFGTSGAVLRQVLLGTGFSPGGIAIVGNTAYVASTTDGLIRTFDTRTGTIGASIATGHSAFGSIAQDATGFWANDYEGGNKAFHITFAGVNDKTVTLSKCGSFCNGLDTFTQNGTSYLLANRGETDPTAVYDLYTTAGTLVTAALLTAPNGSGVSFNGTGYYVADAYDNTLLSYSLSGALLSTVTLGNPIPDSGFGAQRFVTDLAVVVPEPMSLGLLGMGLGFAGLMRRIRRA